MDSASHQPHRITTGWASIVLFQVFNILLYPGGKKSRHQITISGLSTINTKENHAKIVSNKHISIFTFHILTSDRSILKRALHQVHSPHSHREKVHSPEPQPLKCVLTRLSPLKRRSPTTSLPLKVHQRNDQLSTILPLFAGSLW